MAESKAAEKAADAVDAEAAQSVEGVTRVAEVDKKPAGSKAYRADRNLAEVNEGEVVYLDAKSEVGKRLLATGYFEEVDDPQA